MQVFSDAMTADSTSAELTVTGKLLTVLADEALTVQAKNTAPGTASWTYLGSVPAGIARIIVNPPPTIRLRNGGKANRVLITDDNR